ncbi:MAG TPA: hypothetical protein VIT18_00155, partial [Terrimicrobiaceae bacterium]
MKVISPDAVCGGLAGRDLRRARRIVLRVLLFVAAFAVVSCAQREAPVVRRSGPPLCKEGPPSWKTSDGRQLMYRTWGPSDRAPQAVVVGMPG